MMPRQLAMLLAALPATGGVPAGSPHDLVGLWGGDQIRLTITDGGARLMLACGAGQFAMPSTMDRDGGFRVEGVLQTYRPGPTLADAQDSAPKATFAGHLTGDRLILAVTPNGSAARHYVLIRNQRTKLIRCL